MKKMLFYLNMLIFSCIGFSQVTLDSMKFESVTNSDVPMLKIQITHDPIQESLDISKNSKEILSLEKHLSELRNEFQRYQDCSCQEKYLLENKILKLENFIKNFKDNQP